MLIGFVRSMKIGSLCSGVGLLELGLIWAGLGDVVWSCEIEPFCRRILHKQYPESKVYDDVTAIGIPCLDVPEPVDLICFGSPCQDLSSAGKQVGLDGDRSGLFYECARIVAQLRPEWVVVENVASGAKLWVDAMRRELERLGYATLPVPIEARDVGALHRRSRIFLVAHLDRSRERAHPRQPEVASAPEACGSNPADAPSERREARDDAARGAKSPGRKVAKGSDRPTAADADGLALWVDEQWQTAGRQARRLRDSRNPVAGFPGWFGAEPDVVRVVHERASGLDQAEPGTRGLAALQEAMTPADLLATQRREALGNAVVPWCSEVVGYVIQQLRREALTAAVST